MLKSMTVKDLLPNISSKLQPLDHGIICSFKVGYGAPILNRHLDSIGEDKPSSTPINVLQSMQMADYA